MPKGRLRTEPGRRHADRPRSDSAAGDRRADGARRQGARRSRARHRRGRGSTAARSGVRTRRRQARQAMPVTGDAGGRVPAASVASPARTPCGPRRLVVDVVRDVRRHSGAGDVGGRALALDRRARRPAARGRSGGALEAPRAREDVSMRMTLHLLPARDFPMYIAAMKARHGAACDRMLKRIGRRPEARGHDDGAVVDGRARPTARRRSRSCSRRAKAKAGARHARSGSSTRGAPCARRFSKASSATARRAAPQATFVRVDQWLPTQKAADARRCARRAAATRFLDGVRPGDAARLREVVGLHERDRSRLRVGSAGRSSNRVSVDGEPGFDPARDLRALAGASIDRRRGGCCRPSTRSCSRTPRRHHLVEPRFYKRVYRNQGWLSPVVLVGGRIVAVWFLEQRAKTFTVRRPARSRAATSGSRRHPRGSRGARAVCRRPLRARVHENRES